jgi:hypothetical protein
MKKLNGNFKKLLGLGAVALAASAVSKSTKAETLSTEDQSLFGLVSGNDLQDPNTPLDPNLLEYLKSDPRILAYFKASKDNAKLETVNSIDGLINYTGSNFALFDGGTWEKKTGDKQSNGGGYAGTLIRVSQYFYWERVTNFVTPEMFGALGNNINDDSQALNKAFSFNHVELTPGKIYKTTTEINITKDINVNGNFSTITGNGTRIITLNISENTTVKKIELKNLEVNSTQVSDFLLTAETNEIANSWLIGSIFNPGVILENLEIKSCLLSAPNGSINGIKIVPHYAESGGYLNKCTISKNKFYNIGRIGIEIFGNTNPIGGIYYQKNITIENNDFDNLGIWSINGFGVSIACKSKNNIVSKNRVNRFKYIGVELVCNDNSEVSSNVFENPISNACPISIENYALRQYNKNNKMLNNIALGQYIRGFAVFCQDGFFSQGNYIETATLKSHIFEIKNSVFFNDYFTAKNDEAVILDQGSVSNKFIDCTFDVSASTVSTGCFLFTNNSSNNQLINPVFKKDAIGGGDQFSSIGATNNNVYYYSSFADKNINNEFSGAQTFLNISAKDDGGGSIGFTKSFGDVRSTKISSEVIRERFSGSGISFMRSDLNATFMKIFSSGSLLLSSTGVFSEYSSSIFALNSTTKGALMPRMTTTQRNAIVSPAEGLEVYDLTLHKKMCFDGTTWQPLW